MFTFYDDVYKDEEKVWNLCYNEYLGNGGAFSTFYSWIPSYSENIDTQFFSFDRRTSKWLTLLNKCNYNIPENTGVLIDIPVIKNIDDNDSSTYVLIGSEKYPYCNIHYRYIEKAYKTVKNSDGTVYNREEIINDDLIDNI